MGVMLLMFTSQGMGRLPIGVAEFMSVPLTVRNVLVGVLLLLLWQSCFALCGLYQAVTRAHAMRHLLALKIVAASTLGTVLVWTLTVVSGSGALRLRVLLVAWLIALAAEGIGRGFVTFGIPYLRKHTAELKHAIIVGSGDRAHWLLQAVQSGRLAPCEIVGFVDNVEGRVVSPEILSRLLGNLDELESLLSVNAVDRVLVALPVRSCYEAIQRVIATCEKVGVEVIYFPDIFSVSAARHEYAHENDWPTIHLLRAPSDHRLLIKRAIDVLAVSAGLLVIWPLLLACAIAVKLSGPGPVFFSQLRYGYNRRVFRMYKFRTMVQDAEQLQNALEHQNEASGPIFKIRADPRITPVGRILRKLSLDELPQLFNVLRGEMSLVGPRPMSLRDVSRFNGIWLLRRFSVRPGLTCLWQVNGRSNTDFDRWVELDLAYIDNWSLALDMRILLKTVPAVLSGDGAM
ncbi:MAG: sugar transferase [Vicinamibacterales bacterium]